MSSTQQFHFVINPVAGGNKKDGLSEALLELCAQNNVRAEFFHLTGGKDAAAIQAKIEAITPDVVVACGGDGTINLIGSLLLGSTTSLGVLPCGSANGLATELGMTTAIEDNFATWLAGHTLDMDVIRINGQHLCFHLADVGTNARLIQQYDTLSIRGRLGYLWGFLRVFFKRYAVRMRLDVDGHDRPHKIKVEMAVFANARKYGTGAIINPEGKLDDGFFEVCLFRLIPFWQLFGLVYHLFTGTLTRSPYARVLRTQQAHLLLSQPLPLQVDGEVLAEVQEVKAEICTDKLKIIVPAP